MVGHTIRARAGHGGAGCGQGFRRRPPPLRNSPHRSWPRTKPVASPRRALWLTHPGSQPPPRPGTGDTKEKPGLAELEYDQIDTKVMFILLQGEGSSEESVIGHGEQGCAGETRTLW